MRDKQQMGWTCQGVVTRPQNILTRFAVFFNTALCSVGD